MQGRSPSLSSLIRCGPNRLSLSSLPPPFFSSERGKVLALSFPSFPRSILLVQPSFSLSLLFRFHQLLLLPPSFQRRIRRGKAKRLAKGRKRKKGQREREGSAFAPSSFLSTFSLHESLLRDRGGGTLFSQLSLHHPVVEED